MDNVVAFLKKIFLNTIPKDCVRCEACDGSGTGWDWELDCHICDHKGYITKEKHRQLLIDGEFDIEK